MRDYKDWFVNRVLSGLEKEDSQQIARLIIWYEKEQEMERDARYEAALNSAMIADICEKMFGSNANGSPSLMSNSHAGWVCGPFVKPENESFVRNMLKSWNKEIDKETLQRIKQWEKFLEGLKK